MKRSLTIILSLFSLAILSNSGVRPISKTRRIPTAASGGPIAVLHSFTGGSTDGSEPRAGLTLVGTTLYGTTEFGGDHSAGSIFALGTDGTGYRVLHFFGSMQTDGTYPRSAPVMALSWLFGTTQEGGIDGVGTIYKIGLDGTGYTMCRAFAGSPSDAANPGYGSLVPDGDSLCGSGFGGPYAKGCIYRFNPFTYTCSLIYSSTDETYVPVGTPLLDGSTFYGVAMYGGSDGQGSIFKVDRGGTGYALLHSFADADGAYPSAGLVTDGSTLYGTTPMKGPGGKGTLFAVDLDGSNFRVLHAFEAGGSEGAYSVAPLTLADGILFGTASVDGAANGGTLFAIKTDGTGFRVLHAFAGGSADGGHPRWGALILSGSTLYGTATEGGISNQGVVFSYPLSTNIGLGMISSNSHPSPYERVTLTVDAANTELRPATGVEITTRIPAGLTYVSSQASQGSYDPDTQVWTVGSLSPLSSAELRITATVNTSGTLTCWAAKTAGNESDADASDDSASVTLLTVPSSTLLVPVLLSPAAGSTGAPTSVSLKWRDTNSSPDEMKYRVRIKKAGGAYASILVPADTPILTRPGLTPGKTYFWNVMAVGNGTSIKNSPWANGGVDWSFTVAPSATLNPPTLLAPTNGAAGLPSSLTLQWLDTNSDPDERYYQLRIKPEGGTYKTMTLAPGTIAVYQAGLKPGTAYSWSVRAVGNGVSTKTSTWPADFKFTTGAVSIGK